MKRFPLLGRFVAWLVLPLALVVGVVFLHFRASVPSVAGSVDLDGLEGEVRIGFDETGVPHIVATSDRDVFHAMGYLHARDRLWQLEMQRRLARGTLSEIMGADTLPQDVLMRTLDLYGSAATAWPALSSEAQGSLQAYADGVNAWLSTQPGLPPEFVLMDVRPEPWTALDSLAWQKVFALNLSGNYRRELARYTAAQALTDAELSTFFVREALSDREGLAHAPGPAVLHGLGELGDAMERTLGIGGRFYGSNAWVVSGARTGRTGALLANDPHLALQLPSVWYAVVQKGHRLDAAGMSLVGMPMVVFGRNADIAWGGTSMTADVQDLFFEEVDPADPDRYRVGERWAEMTSRVETIRVRADFPSMLRTARAPQEVTLRSTRHGPVISDALGVRTQPVALRWTALDRGDTSYEAIFRLNYATDWDSFRQALSVYVTPALNMLYADRRGNIGMQGVGRIPVRRSGQGGTPAPGWAESHGWSGYIPYEEMPREYNPERGYIVSANNRVVDDDYPYFISNDWASPGRAARIAELIEREITVAGHVDVAATRRMQMDRVSLPARDLLARLTTLEPADARQREALERLRAWDGDMAAGSQAATIFDAWTTHLRDELFSGRLHADWQQRGEANQFNAMIAGVSLESLARILAGQDGTWCTAKPATGRRTCADVMSSSLDRALEELQKLGGSDMQGWAWSELHTARYAHSPFSSIKALRPLFERNVAGGGARDTINVANSQFDRTVGYRQTFGATFRQIIRMDAGNITHLLANSGGQSGHPLSVHYADMTRRFADGGYAPLGDAQAPAPTLLLSRAGSTDTPDDRR